MQLHEIRKFSKRINKIIKEKLFRNFFVALSLVLSLVNLFLVIQANNISLEAWKLGQDNLGFDIDKTSREYVSAAFDDLYSTEENKQTLDNLKKGNILVDENELKPVMDIFEETGSDFCQGTAKLRHIRIYLKNSLAPVCNNDEIYNLFANKKNGTAILCAELFPDSKFAKTLNRENIGTCEFFDSTRFPQVQNRYRFEYK